MLARNAYKRKLLSTHRFCIYCGEQREATEIDHMPNKGMFPKDRPGGLEFPSCKACNSSSKWFEDIAALIGSVLIGNHPEINQHFKTKFIHMVNNARHVLDEIRPTARQRKDARRIVDDNGETFGAFNLNGPIVSSAMLLYGAKLALAIHWKETGKALSTSGQICVLWQSNVQAMFDYVPQQLFERLPERRFLSQGKKTSWYPFEYSSAKAIDAEQTAHWATFGNSFMYYLFAGEDLDLSMIGKQHCFSPGCLLTPEPDPVSYNFGWSIGPTIM